MRRLYAGISLVQWPSISPSRTLVTRRAPRGLPQAADASLASPEHRPADPSGLRALLRFSAADADHFDAVCSLLACVGHGATRPHADEPVDSNQGLSRR